MRASLIVTAIVVILAPSFAQAKSCSDVLNTCLKMYQGARGGQGLADPSTQCRNIHNGCMATGTWVGKTTIKGLEKK